MSKKKNETVAMAVNNNTETVTDAGNKVGTNTTVGIDAASNLHKSQETDAETVMAAGIDNGSAARKGGVVDVAAVIGTATDEVSVGADAVPDGNNSLDNDNGNAPENDVTIDEEDIQSTNDLGEGTASDADGCNPTDAPESEKGTDAVLSTDICTIAENASVDDTSTAAGNGVAAEYDIDAVLASVYGNADDAYLNVSACIDNSTLPSRILQGYPITVFPEWMKQMIETVSEEMEAGAPIAGNLGFSIVSFLSAKNIYVRAGTLKVPTNIWIVTGADPGEAKSPVYDAMTAPLRNSPLRTYLIDDVSLFSLMKKFGTVRKIGAIHDEHVFLEQMMKTEHSPAPILHSYEERDSSYERGNLEEPLEAEKPSLTLGIVAQSDTLSEYYLNSRGQSLKRKGFWDRMPIDIVKALAGSRTIKIVDDETVRPVYDKYEECINRMIAFDQAMEQSGDTIELRLSKEAQKMYVIFLQGWEDKIKVDGNFAMIKGWIGKGRGFLLRVAGILYVMDLFSEDRELTPEIPLEIPVEVMQRAIRLADYYRQKLIAWHHTMIDEKHVITPAEHLYKYMKKKGKSEWRKRELEQAMKHTSVFQEDGVFEGAIDDLLNQDLITITESTNTRGPRTYTVHLVKAA